MKIEHYLSVGVNLRTGEFAFCSVENPDNFFCRTLSLEKRKNDEIVFRWHDWRDQYQGATHSFAVVSSHLDLTASFFALRIPYDLQPFVPRWIDLESYVAGFCIGAGLKPLSIINISATSTPGNPLAEAVHRAKLWKLVQQLPESYALLNREINLDAIGFEIKLREGKVSSGDQGVN